MKPQVKLALYLVTLLGTLVFGVLFVRGFRHANRPVESVAPDIGALTNEAAGAEPTAEREPTPTQNKPIAVGRGFARVFFWGVFGFAALLGLGSLIAYDVAHYAGHRTTQALFDEDGEELPESTYDQVETAYNSGQFLEAVRLLREFLKENPRALHAQVRIAEIYEKDLNNPLAAALEYEEVLQHRMEAERKGWTAIHLVNLYNRLEKPEQAVALLRRVVVECPDTPAAAKARERLDAAGIDLPEPSQGPGHRQPSDTPSSPSSGLPPGFRPRGS